MQEMKEISGQPTEENYSRREEKSRTHKRCKKEDQTEKKHEFCGYHALTRETNMYRTNIVNITTLKLVWNIKRFCKMLNESLYG